MNGFFNSEYGTVQLTFYNLMGTLASFLGNLSDDSHMDGDWTEMRQWNDWTDPILNVNKNQHFFFGKMSLQKLISLKDRADLVNAQHLFLP